METNTNIKTNSDINKCSQTNNCSKNFMNIFQENSCKRKMCTLILLSVLILIIVNIIYTIRETYYIGVADNYPNSISVNGKAEEYIKPDTFQFSINIEEEGKNVAEATKKAAEKENLIIKTLKSQGIDEKYIKTKSYSVQDKYEYIQNPCAKDMSIPCVVGESKIVGAIVYHTIEVKIKDILKEENNEKRNKITTELANQNIKTSDYSFTIFDIEESKAQVKAKAIENAKENAKKLEKQLNVNLGNITGFFENPISPSPIAMGADMAMMRTEKSSAETVTTSSGPQIQTGEQKVSMEIQLTYLLKN